MKTSKEIWQRLNEIERTINAQQGNQYPELEIEYDVLKWVLVSTGDCEHCGGDFEPIGKESLHLRLGYPIEDHYLTVEIFRCKQCKRFSFV